MARAKKEEEMKVTTVAEQATEEILDDEFELDEELDTELDEEVDINAPIFEDGPTLADIEGWKEKYGQIYMTEVDDNEIFIWRVINRKEFKEVMKLENADAMYREERVCEKCILYPEGYTFVTMGQGKAGTPTVLAEQIMERSGFSSKTGPIPL